MSKKLKKARSPRVAQKRGQVEHEILRNAQIILSEDGPKAVTLASVAGQMGMTKQSLYHYYSSKKALDRALVANLLEQEVEALLAAVARQKTSEKVLGTLIRAFHSHYVDRLGEFRAIYCSTQMYRPLQSNLDEITLREKIHPRTRQLFDILERRLAEDEASRAERKRARQLAFTAWTSALGLMTMLGVAEATSDPIRHPEKVLLKTLSTVFDNAASAGF